MQSTRTSASALSVISSTANMLQFFSVAWSTTVCIHPGNELSNVLPLVVQTARQLEDLLPCAGWWRWCTNEPVAPIYIWRNRHHQVRQRKFFVNLASDTNVITFVCWWKRYQSDEFLKNKQFWTLSQQPPDWRGTGFMDCLCMHTQVSRFYWHFDSVYMQVFCGWITVWVNSSFSKNQACPLGLRGREACRCSSLSARRYETYNSTNRGRETDKKEWGKS